MALIVPREAIPEPPRLVMPQPQFGMVRIMGIDRTKPETEQVKTAPVPKYFVVGMLFLGVLEPFKLLNVFKCIADPMNPRGMALIPMGRWCADWVDKDKEEIKTLIERELAPPQVIADPEAPPEEPKL